MELTPLKKLQSERRRLAKFLDRYSTASDIPGIPASEQAWLLDETAKRLAAVDQEINERTSSVFPP
jgi:hypothetical protein